LSCHPEPSGHASHGEVGGLASEGTMINGLFCSPCCSWQGYSKRVGANVGDEATESHSVL